MAASDMKGGNLILGLPCLRKMIPGKQAMRIVLLIVATSCLVAVNVSASAFDLKPPFAPGEKLTYSGRWGVIPAGSVTLEVLPQETIAGVALYHFAMTTKTSPAVDFLYKIRERQDSYVDMASNHSFLYTKITKSKHPSDTIINFDWNKLEVTRSDFGQKSPPIKIMPGSIDPLALLYMLRLQEIKENSVIQIPVTNGKTNFMVDATVGNNELIAINGKSYQTFVITPDMEKLESVVEKNKNPKLKIWLSADPSRIPVRIQSSIGIVSFIFELVAMAS
jgi:hypothetical protein